jgi:hypothetical protein
LSGDVNVDKLVKSNPKCRDGLWKKFDILGVVSETVIRQYIWYGELPFQTYNDVDRTFYESINVYRPHIKRPINLEMTRTLDMPQVPDRYLRNLWNKMFLPVAG